MFIVLNSCLRFPIMYVRFCVCVCLQKVDQDMPGSFTLVSKQRTVIQKGDRSIEMKYSKRLAN